MNPDSTAAQPSARLFTWLALGTFAFCYAGVAVSLVNVWLTYPLYSFGFGVPLISGYLVWIRSRQVAVVRPKPDYVFGAPLLAAGLLLLIVGVVGSMQTIAQASLMPTAAGLVLVLFGREALKTYRFPFAYLSLMVPIWDILFDQLQHPSQLVSARIAQLLLPLVGIPVLRQGTVLSLPSVALSVRPQCSGVNQLVVLIAMVLPAAYLWLDGYGRRIVLFLVAIGVGYVSNGFRIALVGWLATHNLGDGDVAASYAHLLEGLVVSAVGYGLIVSVLSWLARRNRHQDAIPSASFSTVLRTAVPRWLLLDAGVLAMLLLGSLYQIAIASSAVQPADALVRFPERVGTWTADPGVPAHSAGVREDFIDAYPTEAGVRQFACVDDELVRTYRDGPTSPVKLYVGYYRRQREGCELTGDIGKLLDAASTPLLLTSPAGPVPIREIVRERDGARQGLLFWYAIDGRLIPDFYGVKARTIMNGLLRQRTDGAVVMVSWEESSSSQAHTRERAIEFVQAVLPMLQLTLPRHVQ